MNEKTYEMLKANIIREVSLCREQLTSTEVTLLFKNLYEMYKSELEIFGEIK